MTQPIQSASLIAALHARYEATQTEYATIERAESANRRQSQEDAAEHCRSACMTLHRESNAIRNLILYQVPDTWSDALILQYHIVCAHDMYAADDQRREIDSERLQMALDTLFDFMCAEVRADLASIGAILADGAARVLRLRRLRTGVVEA